jgi:hypothetical protein
MFSRRFVPKLFFLGAAIAGAIALVDVPSAEALEEEATCMDGNRAMCAKVPVNDATFYYYWV